jgi:long-chain acyl-CoA synthetase
MALAGRVALCHSSPGGMSVADRQLIVRRGPPLEPPPEARASNLVELVWRTVDAHGDREAIRWKVPGEGWSSRSFAQLGDWILRASIGLQSIGVREGTRVAIVSASRPEWLVADLASLALGAVTCPIHPAESTELIGFMLHNVGAEVALVESRQQLAKVTAVRDACPELRRVVVMEPGPGGDDEPPHLDALVPESVPADVERSWREGWSAIGPDAVATIVHTSGTTGQPKGVILTHGNILHNCYAAVQAIPFSADDLALTILPLSHMFARSAGMFAPLGIGVPVAFAEPVMERWASNLEEVRPTVMLTVPPFFGRIHRRVMNDIERRPPIQQRLFRWAVALGPRRYANHLAGRHDGIGLRLQLWLANWLVFGAIKRRTGGRLRFFACGGAPLPREVGEFFYAMGMQILEGYGLSETAPFLTLNTPESFKFGTVGVPFADTEIGIDRASGEILARGPQVMRGYLNLPEETAKALDAEGWFHTGDIGEFDEAGRLVITDRIKNLIVLSNGKKVTPAPMEAALAASPYIAQAVILGEGRERTGVVVALDRQHVLDWAAAGRIQLGDGVGAGTGSRASGDGGALAESPEVQALLQGEVRRLLGDFPAYERPRRVALLPRALTEEAGEVTSLGKPRRSVVVEHWPDAVARLFPPRGGEVEA